MNDTYYLILLSCLAGMGNFGVNAEMLDEKKKHNIENLLIDILKELRILNERLENGNELSR